ncbi:hypothetical protein PGTUg99_011061 [Puccinia graminis f. sp. tritici]|uniref:Uncharacterized protein n=1 Tax=Puccinia graminis f. sp. tritici TaxID=56615 RepID=A0A5B0R4A6_PUCGR|nr:hypothetical protein PGTUg99_011061 [Puccinia graminis f. sp. tritici]
MSPKRDKYEIRFSPITPSQKPPKRVDPQELRREIKIRGFSTRLTERVELRRTITLHMRGNRRHGRQTCTAVRAVLRLSLTPTGKQRRKTRPFSLWDNLGGAAPERSTTARPGWGYLFDVARFQGTIQDQAAEDEDSISTTFAL